MTDKEILQNVVKKISTNGFDFKEFDKKHLIQTYNSIEEGINKNYYYILIFSHDFAEAFWGDWDLEKVGIKVITRPTGHVMMKYPDKCLKFSRWEYHLQQMVLEKEPLKYLEKFLKD